MILHSVMNDQENSEKEFFPAEMLALTPAVDYSTNTRSEETVPAPFFIFGDDEDEDIDDDSFDDMEDDYEEEDFEDEDFDEDEEDDYDEEDDDDEDYDYEEDVDYDDFDE